jgi:hypothetical protein
MTTQWTSTPEFEFSDSTADGGAVAAEIVTRRPMLKVRRKPRPVAVGRRRKTRRTEAGEKEVRVRFWLPYRLRGRFKAAAKRVGMRPSEVVLCLMEGFARTGQLPVDEGRGGA